MFIKNKKLAKLALIFVLLLVASPIASVFSQSQSLPRVAPPLGEQGPIQSPNDVIGLLRQILVWLATIFWIAAVIFIFWAALTYLLARGDPEKANKAKDMLKYAIIAIVIGLVAYVIPTFIDQFLRARA
jgi:Na+-driven multidrug efflux pump